MSSTASSSTSTSSTTATTVVNIKVENLKKIGYQNLQAWKSASDKHIYIGRDMTTYIRGATESEFCNPFSVKKYTLKECIELFIQHLETNRQLLDSIKPKLKGCTLGCFCKPQMCHGDLLAKIADSELDPLECLQEIKNLVLKVN
jgi:hypothetical protein